MSTSGVSGSDTLTGTSSGEKLVGGGGSDTIDGGGGSDFINAGGGNDSIIYDQNHYKILGGGGIDTLLFLSERQNLNFGTQAINGIEALRLGGLGGHSVTFSAADVIRVSDNDRFLITLDPAPGATSSRLSIGSGWSFASLGADNKSQILTNGGASITVQLPIVIDGFSGNASIDFAAGADRSVTEDDGSGDANRLLQVSGSLTVDDPNAGQGLLLPALLGTELQGTGKLVLTLDTAGTATAAGEYVYTYSYSVSNGDVQYLGEGKELKDAFTVTTIDGSTKTLEFTVVGVNDAAVIGQPDNASVTEDGPLIVGSDGKSYVFVDGHIGITDADAGEAYFIANTTTLVKPNCSLELQANGDYRLIADNAKLQSLPEGGVTGAFFNVVAADGTTNRVEFQFKGGNDAPVIVDGGMTSRDVAELAYNADGANSTTAKTISGSFQFLDVDILSSLTPVPSDKLTVEGATYKMAGVYGNLSFTISEPEANTSQRIINWTYSYTDKDLNPLTQGQETDDRFELNFTDGYASASQDITISLTGAADAPPPPIVKTITESSKGYITYGDPVPNASTGTQSFTAGDGVKNISVTPSAGNTPNLGTVNADYNQTTKSILWSYSVRERYIDYLTNGETLTQRYTVKWLDGGGTEQSQEIEIQIAGVSDGEVERTGNSTFALQESSIYRLAGSSNASFSGPVDAQIYGSSASNSFNFGYFGSTPTSFDNLLVRGGDSGDTFTLTRDMQESCEIFGDKGNDTFRISTSYDCSAHLWGGPGSDNYEIFAGGSGTSATKGTVPTVEDFYVADRANGGDWISLSSSISLNSATPLQLADQGAITDGKPEHLYTLYASANGATFALLNLVGVGLDLDTLRDYGSITFASSAT